MLKKVAEEEAREGISFNILEVGGRTMKSILQKSNPTATPGCAKTDCPGCCTERGGGGRCHKSNINYEMECQLCPEREKHTYIGETSKNLYTRCKQHIANEKREGEDDESSFIKKHMTTHHEGMQSKFTAKVTHTNKDSFSRQVREGVLIRRSRKTLVNTKSEWFQPPIYKIQNEIIRE